MTVEGSPRAVRMALWINVKDDVRDLPPVCIISVCIQQPEIGDDMLLVIGRQHGIIRCQVRNIRVERG